MATLRFKIFMESKGILGNLYLDRYYSQYKHLSIEKEKHKATFQEIEEDTIENRDKLNSEIKKIEKDIPTFNKVGLAVAWKLESIK